ncbi:MAG: type II toxin-antitoxin system prevent-host-death family antitoxin [Azospirillum brasilense]|jgi:prevent-host-death family protein|nr:MAG: type II toxin-antitoxin system prevent-host-death family antitoxin [Azospirillum brasilense]
MDEMISATDANRSFSHLLRRVREEGKAFTVTSHGESVARLVPCRAAEADRLTARDALLRRLMAQAVSEAGRWTRDELYER